MARGVRMVGHGSGVDRCDLVAAESAGPDRVVVDRQQKRKR
jgi:hypothetical protein